jgi:hypothetical protein
VGFFAFWNDEMPVSGFLHQFKPFKNQKLSVEFRPEFGIAN